MPNGLLGLGIEGSADPGRAHDPLSGQARKSQTPCVTTAPTAPEDSAGLCARHGPTGRAGEDFPKSAFPAEIWRLNRQEECFKLCRQPLAWQVDQTVAGRETVSSVCDAARLALALAVGGARAGGRRARNSQGYQEAVPVVQSAGTAGGRGDDRPGGEDARTDPRSLKSELGNLGGEQV